LAGTQLSIKIAAFTAIQSFLPRYQRDTNTQLRITRALIPRRRNRQSIHGHIAAQLTPYSLAILLGSQGVGPPPSTL
jgi:hypothetical protein